MFLNSGKSLEDVFHIRVTTRTLTLKSAHDFHTETQAKPKKIKIDERVPTKIRHEKKVYSATMHRSKSTLYLI